MKFLLVLSIMVSSMASIANACSIFQKKQCQANPAQCEAAGICQGQSFQDDEVSAEVDYSEPPAVD